MRLRSVTLALALALTAALPAVAHGAAGGLGGFPDRVVDGPLSKLQAGARQAAGTQTIAVPTREGYSLSVTFAPNVPVDPALAAAYVGFLDALPHGPELAGLRLTVALATDVPTLCGGQPEDGIVACYGPADQTMIIPVLPLDATGENGESGGYSTAYVLTHEYGHHIAANRSNTLLGAGAIDLGPKRWASYELVCDRWIDGDLAPGDEGDAYARNPGESWAEVYARLTFPEQPWTFTELLTPDPAALAAARTDVLTPWTGNTARRFTMSASRRTQSFDVPLALDGSLSATVRGRHGADVGVTVTSGPQKVGHSKARGSRNTWSMQSGCREAPTETLTFKITRSSGTGPVALWVSYPG